MSKGGSVVTGVPEASMVSALSRSASCHGSQEHDRHGQGFQLALLGMPNTGKSTLFNRLTGGNAHIANWPGLTVELLRGPMPDDGHGGTYELVDLPGIHDLSGGSEDEAVVQRFMRNTPPDLVLVVLNASQISSQLRLLLQMRHWVCRRGGSTWAMKPVNSASASIIRGCLRPSACRCCR